MFIINLGSLIENFILEKLILCNNSKKASQLDDQSVVIGKLYIFFQITFSVVWENAQLLQISIF